LQTFYIVRNIQQRQRRYRL